MPSKGIGYHDGRVPVTQAVPVALKPETADDPRSKQLRFRQVQFLF